MVEKAIKEKGLVLKILLVQNQTFHSPIISLVQMLILIAHSPNQIIQAVVIAISLMLQKT